MPAVAELLHLVAVLFVVLMAPKRMLTRVRGLDVIGLVNLVQNLEWLRRRGRKLRYPGESLETVAARIDLIVWIARYPVKAHRHLAVRTRGWRRWLSRSVAPVSFAPPRIACAPLRAGERAPAFADSS